MSQIQRQRALKGSSKCRETAYFITAVDGKVTLSLLNVSSLLADDAPVEYCTEHDRQTGSKANSRK